VGFNSSIVALHIFDPTPCGSVSQTTQKLVRQTVDLVFRCRSKAYAHDAGIGYARGHGGDGSS
jgi:hypothetical protein